MPKLHEALAVEGDLAGTAKKLSDEARDTFAKKPTHFLSDTTVTTYFDDNKSQLNTTTQTAMVTTVSDKLDYLAPALARYFNVYVTKETTNQIAVADVTLPDGTVFLSAVPATVLLGFETKLKEMRSVYEALPTLQPGVIWEPAAELGKGVYKSKNPDSRFVTEKITTAVVLAEATKEHKAQVKEVVNDVPVARREITHQSGMLSPSDKSDVLGRIDILIRAFKEARQRANSTEIVPTRGFGETLLTYINGDLVA